MSYEAFTKVQEKVNSLQGSIDVLANAETAHGAAILVLRDAIDALKASVSAPVKKRRKRAKKDGVKAAKGQKLTKAGVPAKKPGRKPRVAKARVEPVAAVTQ